MFNDEPLFRFRVAQIEHSYLLENTMKKAVLSIELLMALAISSGLLAPQEGFVQIIRLQREWT
jgi:hypothetical protein